VKPVAGMATQLRAVGSKLGSSLPAQARRPGAQVELQRNGKPLALASRPGRRRKTDPISSSGGAVAEAARRRRSNGGHVRPGSLRREAGGGASHVVKGGGSKLAGRRQRRPDARSPRRNPKRIGKPLVLPIKAGRGRTRNRNSSAGAQDRRS